MDRIIESIADVEIICGEFSVFVDNDFEKRHIIKNIIKAVKYTSIVSGILLEAIMLWNS